VEYAKYNYIFITDISVNEQVAEKIEYLQYRLRVEGSLGAEFVLLDHHKTAEWLNKYSWAKVTPVKIENLYYNGISQFAGDFDGKVEVKTAGTSMLFDYLYEKMGLFNSMWSGDYAQCSNFVEIVRRWDTWDWFNVFKGEALPKRLNSLVYLIGKERFVNRFSDNASLDFNDGEKLIIEIEEESIKNYIEKVSRNVHRVAHSKYNIGLVFAERYTSELGNAIAAANDDLDFVAIVNIGGGTVSFRGVKDYIDLGEFAKSISLEGGGHPKAAGSRMPKAITNVVVDIINTFYLEGKIKC
jgi:oligoribonuclease NrnB/cAMP/cGMP phosphodiesterase (DHH superfamily)